MRKYEHFFVVASVYKRLSITQPRVIDFFPNIRNAIAIFQQGIYQDERHCISKSVPVMPLSRKLGRAMLPRP
jgi:hypothetical protein